jgi:MoaA/NifB/PqqE/SkfB family radical SAM enzyme
MQWYKLEGGIFVTTPTCKVPWVSITLSGNGDIKPCCVYRGGEYSLHRGDTLDSVWKELDSLRDAFIKQEHPDRCIQCWKREASLGHSRRTWYDDKISQWPEKYELDPPMQLRHMDLNFGNTCNLKCRMCGSWGSTTWFKEEVKLHEINPNFNRNPNMPKPTVIDAEYWRDKRELFENLERIDFKGGEPMMQEGMFDFLEYLVEWGIAPHITIAYTTNGTKTPERLKDLWPHFKRVKLIISVEGTGKLYNYIRSGDVQGIDQLVENIHWFDQFDNLRGSFNSAIQIYNIFDLNNLLEWFRDRVNASKKWHTDPDTFKFDCLVSSPGYLDINIMPDKLKQHAIDIIDQKNYHSLQTIKSTLQRSNYDAEKWKLFIDFTQELDKMRKTDVTTVVPQLKEYFL